MASPLLRLDEHTLAAFLAGTLPEARRQRVIAHLVRNSRDRRLLVMCFEALDAARHPAPPGTVAGRAA